MGVVCEMTSITSSLLVLPLRITFGLATKMHARAQVGCGFYIDEIIEERWSGVVDVWWEVRQGNNGCGGDIGGEGSNGSGKWWSGRGGRLR